MCICGSLGCTNIATSDVNFFLSYPRGYYKCGIFGIIANCKLDINDLETVCKPVHPIIGVYIFFLFHPRGYYKLPLCVTFNTFDNVWKS